MRLLPVCPLCQEPLRGHRVTTLAEAGKVEDTVMLLEALAAKNWETVCGIHSFLGDQNTFIAKAVECGARGYTLTIFDESHLEGISAVVAQQTLGTEEWAALRGRFREQEWFTV